MNRVAATLVDLVIVVLITGILAAAGAPRFAAAVAELRCQAVAERIAVDLNFARRTAEQTCTATTVNFTSDQYEMVGVAHPFQTGAPYSVALSDIDGAALLTQIDIAGTQSITYNSYGLIASPTVSNLSSTTGRISVAIGSATTSVVINFTTGEAGIE